MYRAVNEKFADAIARVWRPGDLVWVHDYQLSLVPQHAPRAHPRRDDRLLPPHPLPRVRGAPHPALARADPRGDARRGPHRLSHVHVPEPLRLVGAAHPRASRRPDDRIFVDGREIRLGVFPIGVDAQTFGEARGRPRGARARSRRSAPTRAASGSCSASIASTTRRASRGACSPSSACSSASRTGAARCASCRSPSPRATRCRATRSSAGTVNELVGSHQRRVLVGGLGAHPLRAPVAQRAAGRGPLPRGRRDARDAAARRHEPRREGVRHAPAPTRTACSC